MRSLSRRELIRASSAWAAAAGISACSGDQRASGSSTATSTSTSTTVRPAGSLNDVEHVVIFFQENRSYDHYFAARPGAGGFGDPAAPVGDPTTAWHQPDPSRASGVLMPYRLDTSTTSAACGPDPDHSWDSQHSAWNEGANDRFAATMGPAALGYFARADVPYYWALADEFTLCDRYFGSVLGPTTPNRLYTMSATIDPAAMGGGPVTANLTGPFDWTTYPERLTQAGVSWRVYHEADDYDDNPLKWFTAFQDLSPSDPLFDAALRNRPANAFVEDAIAGDLPQVSWIVAPMAKSEHPPFAPAIGEDMCATVLAALMGNAELWATTVFILSYDENGGYFDHVPPPVPPPGTTGEFVGSTPIGLGFRVPTTIVSPWSHGGRVCSDVFDHTSTLRFLEQRFGVEVPNLSQWRRSTCGDLTSTLDFTSFDPRVPSLPATAARLSTVAAACATLPAAAPPDTQLPPSVAAN